MLRRFLRLLLLFEVFLYAFIGLLLMNLFNWRVGWVLLLLIGLALGCRIWLVLLTYGCAWLFRSASPPEHSLGSRQIWHAVLKEVLALTLIQFAHAFDRYAVKQRQTEGFAKAPLLLIHGYCCNQGFWWWLKPRLEAQGHCVATLTLEPLHGDIDGYAEQVAKAIDRLCLATGKSSVTLVGHSMGGLVARAYLRRYGEFRVSRLITLGTPHHGSELAYLGMGRNARQMRPGSAWLKELANYPVSVDCISIFSWHDNYVIPQHSAMQEGARNHGLEQVGHLTMSMSPVALDALLAAAA